MSLLTDIIFVKALRSNSELMSELAAGDVYNTTIGLPDAELINAPIPYCIVTFDGMTNTGETKDDSYGGESDQVTIGIEVAAATRPALGEIITAVRATIREYFADHVGDDSDEDYALIPDDISLAAGGVMYDSLKPCYWQSLTYSCDVDV